MNAGISVFTFGAENPANYETTFSINQDILSWNSSSFPAGQATFGFPLSGTGDVLVSFNGSLPASYGTSIITVVPLANAPGNLNPSLNPFHFTYIC